MRCLKNRLLSAGLVFLSLHAVPAIAHYDQHPRAEEFIAEASAEYQLDPALIRQWLSRTERLESVLEAIQRPAEKVKEWDEYQDIFLTTRRISSGKAFLQEHDKLLRAAEQQYGVDRHIIAAIIGVETFYGTRQGNFRVLDSLATLAFDYPQRPLFWRELKAFFALTRTEQLDPPALKVPMPAPWATASLFPPATCITPLMAMAMASAIYGAIRPMPFSASPITLNATVGNLVSRSPSACGSRATTIRPWLMTS